MKKKKKKTEPRLKIVFSNVTVFRAAGAGGFINGVTSPKKHLEVQSYRCVCSQMDLETLSKPR